MAFNPLQEKGTPIEKQIRSWAQIVQEPYDKDTVDPMTRVSQILLNGLEVEAWNFKHQFARQTDNMDVKQHLARTRHVEDQQQTTINWLTPADQTALETAIAYEQAEVGVAAMLAQNEPDEYVKESIHIGMLEDYDHLYRFGEMYRFIEDKNPSKILKGTFDTHQAIPLSEQHNDISVRLRKHYDKDTASPVTKVNVQTLIGAQQQTHNYFKEHGVYYGSPLLRKLYAEIGDVEEEHTTQMESLCDPNETMFEKLVLHEFAEVWNYYNLMNQEKDSRIKKIYEQFLSYELEHLRLAGELLKKHDRKDPEEIVGSSIITPTMKQKPEEYVESILKTKSDVRLTNSAQKGFAKKNELPADWPSFKVQKMVNADGSPSEMAIQIVKTAKL